MQRKDYNKSMLSNQYILYVSLLLCISTHLQAYSIWVCVHLTCLCVRCLRRASLRVCVARSAPLPFIRWRPQERDYVQRNKPAEVRGARQKKPHIIREGRTEGMGRGTGGRTEAGEQTEEVTNRMIRVLDCTCSCFSHLLLEVNYVSQL